MVVPCFTLSGWPLFQHDCCVAGAPFAQVCDEQQSPSVRYWDVTTMSNASLREHGTRRDYSSLPPWPLYVLGKWVLELLRLFVNWVQARLPGVLACSHSADNLQGTSVCEAFAFASSNAAGVPASSTHCHGHVHGRMALPGKLSLLKLLSIACP